MNLLTLGVGVVAKQWLRMLPARQGADFANTRLIDDIQERGTAAIAVDGSLGVRRLDLAAVHLDLAVLADEGLGQVQGVVVVLGVSQADRDLVCGSALADLLHFRRVTAKRVLHVLAYHVKVDGALPGWVHVRLYTLDSVGMSIPYPAGIVGNPDFGKGHKIAALAGGLLDESTGLVDGALQVEVDAFGLDSGDANCGRGGLFD